MNEESGRDHTHELDALAAFVDGRLEAPEREEIVAHLADCRACRAVLAEMGRYFAASRTERRGRPVPSWALPVAATLVLSAAASVILLRQPAGLPSPGAPDGAPPAAEPGRTSPEVGIAPGPGSPPPGREITGKEDRAASEADEGLLVKRGGRRSVGGKSFRLVAGEWVDSAYDPTAALPAVVSTGPGERDALLRRLPGLAPYAALGERVLVVHDGTVYRLRPAARPPTGQAR